MSLTEEQRGTVGFDLEKARADLVTANKPTYDYLEATARVIKIHMPGAIDEIERLRAENLELQWEVFGPDGIRANQACIIADQAASISELEIEITEPKAGLEQSERVIDQQAAKIKELEAQLTITNVALENATRKPNVVYITGTGELGPDADAKPREGLYGKYRISKADGSPVDPNADYFVLRLDTDPVARRAAREYSYMTPDRTLAIGLQEKLTKYNPKMEDCINLQFFGMEKPRIWRITEERVGLLEYCLESLLDAPDIEESTGPRHSIELIRAMLKEAE